MNTLRIEHTYQITAPHFCAGLVVRGGVCVEAAPILKWARGKTLGVLKSYFARKGWKCERVT